MADALMYFEKTEESVEIVTDYHEEVKQLGKEPLLQSKALQLSGKENKYTHSHEPILEFYLFFVSQY